MSVDTFIGLLLPDRCLSRTEIFAGRLGRLVFKDEDQMSVEERRSHGWPV